MDVVVDDAVGTYVYVCCCGCGCFGSCSIVPRPNFVESEELEKEEEEETNERNTLIHTRRHMPLSSSYFSSLTDTNLKQPSHIVHKSPCSRLVIR